MAFMAERIKLFVVCVGFTIFLPLGAAAKQSMAASFLVVAAILILTTFLSNPQKLIPNRYVLGSFILFCSYVAAIHLFSVSCEPCKSLIFTKLLMLGLILWVASTDLTKFRYVPGPEIPFFIASGVLLTSIFLNIEFLTDGFVYRSLTDRLNDPEVSLSRYNRVTSALIILVWPITAWLYFVKRYFLAAGLIVVVTFSAVLSHSSSAMVVSILAPFVALLACFWPIFTFWLGLVCLVIFSVLSPLLFVSLLTWVRPFADGLPPSTLDRIEIWHRSALAVFESPWIGHGIGVTRYLPLPKELSGKYKYHVTPTTHPHDAAIQLWLELGFIGLTLFMLVLWFTIRPLTRISACYRVAALASASAVLFTSLVSFGLWQETWLGIIGMLVIWFKFFLQYSTDN